MADKKYHDKICSDELESPYGNKRELEDSGLVTVLTKYFKKMAKCIMSVQLNIRL